MTLGEIEVDLAARFLDWEIDLATRRCRAITPWSLLLFAAVSLPGCEGWENPDTVDMGRPAGSIQLPHAGRASQPPAVVPPPVAAQTEEQPAEAHVPPAEASPQVP